MTDTPHGLPEGIPTRIHRLEIPAGDASRTLDLVAPADPDAYLDDPTIRQRYHADNYMPYWPIIWPSGLMLASRILFESACPPALPPPPTPARVIELGCGLGASGIAAGLRGWQVTFTDYDHQAVRFAAHNALRNGIPADRVRALYMD